MRKGLLLVGMAAALGANAVRLTPEAALQRVIDAPQAKAMAKPVTAGRTPMLVYTEEINAQPAAYLFDRGEGNGYLIVSADDEVAPLLGYSDAGTIDVTDMPDGLRYWLGYYAAEIENVRTNGTVSVLAASPARKAIAPMVATRWNQSAPYNNMCPTSGSDRCVTGCVATALAQVMKYHNWPPLSAQLKEIALIFDLLSLFTDNCTTIVLCSDSLQKHSGGNHRFPPLCVLFRRRDYFEASVGAL